MESQGFCIFVELIGPDFLDAKEVTGTARLYPYLLAFCHFLVPRQEIRGTVLNKRRYFFRPRVGLHVHRTYSICSNHKQSFHILKYSLIISLII
jgi:hypothetical protein